MATRAVTRLPYGVGQTGSSFYLLVAGLLALVGLGAYAYSRQFTGGLSETGLRDFGTMGGATWGLYIVIMIHFVGVSLVGITLAVLLLLCWCGWRQPCKRLRFMAYQALQKIRAPLKQIIAFYQVTEEASALNACAHFALLISPSPYPRTDCRPRRERL